MLINYINEFVIFFYTAAVWKLRLIHIYCGFQSNIVEFVSIRAAGACAEGSSWLHFCILVCVIFNPVWRWVCIWICQFDVCESIFGGWDSPFCSGLLISRTEMSHTLLVRLLRLLALEKELNHREGSSESYDKKNAYQLSLIHLLGEIATSFNGSELRRLREKGDWQMWI